ncbi:MAG: DUF362 domain-containing protein [Acidobacteriota bacterium]
MNDVHSRLARRLDGLPQGYPATESGVEVRILRKIFSPEDAAWALRLKPLPETAATIARRLRLPVEEVRAQLDRMADRGQIASFWFKDRHCYALAPFVVGIWEFQLNHMDRELAALFEEYAPTLLRTLGGSAPALARVIPVNRRLSAQAQVLPYEDLRTLLGDARAFRVADCLCRTERALQGHPCSHPIETCLSFSREEHAYENVPEWGRPISRDEAFRLLDDVEREGLVHCTYNVQREPMFLCNCCSCCCGFLRSLNEFQAPYMLAHSSLRAEIAEDGCTACGECASGRCPVGAIAEREGAYRVDGERCIGCGVCAVACPADAIALVARPPAEVPEPPRHVIQWHLDRATQRQGALRGLALRGWLTWEGLKMAAAQRRERG